MKLSTLRPVHIDGLIFVLIAFFGAIASALGSDDAAKYIMPATLWYVKNICTAIAAGLLALKMYRSTAYAADVKEQDTGKTAAGDPLPLARQTGHTEIITKTP